MFLIAWNYFISKKNLQPPCTMVVKLRRNTFQWENLWKRKKMGKTHKMLNAWLRKCRSILTFRGNKAYKERDQKENAWRAVEQFWIVFLSIIRDQAILWKAAYFSLLLSLKSSLAIQITWNAILFHWHASPAINYVKLLVVFFFKTFPHLQLFPFSFDLLLMRETNKALTAPIS